MTDDRGNSNQRVTNAVLSVKLDHVIEGMDEIKDTQKEQGREIQENSQAREKSKTRWEQHDKEHAALNTKKWAGDIGAGIVASIPGLAALFTKS